MARRKGSTEMFRSLFLSQRSTIPRHQLFQWRRVMSCNWTKMCIVTFSRRKSASCLHQEHIPFCTNRYRMNQCCAKKIYLYNGTEPRDFLFTGRRPRNRCKNQENMSLNKPMYVINLLQDTFLRGQFIVSYSFMTATATRKKNETSKRNQSFFDKIWSCRYRVRTKF